MSDISSDVAYVRSEIAPALPAPIRTSGVVLWLRKNLFASAGDTGLTIIALLFLLWAIPPLLNFLIFHAVPPGGTVEQCRVTDVGACWAYIASEIEFFIFGFYPMELYWRPIIVFVLFFALIIPLLWPSAPFKIANAIAFFIPFPVLAVVLLSGGVFGLRYVPTEQWGGLLVTLIISVVGICCALPLGILLALGRQSKLPIVKTLCIAFIELVRAVPLITVLFMASIMLPLFMPQGTTVDKLVRALVGVTLFSSAYMAEVVRGGMQAIGRGQYEAAAALGLGYWKRMGFIILPQALKHVIPGIVGTFISLFKDTSLVYIVGMKDLLEAVKTKNDALEWASPTQSVTGYIFAAAVFWMFCFSISRYSRYWENRLNTGHKR
jgi:general L-amino acid transport system permease protein